MAIIRSALVSFLTGVSPVAHTMFPDVFSTKGELPGCSEGALALKGTRRFCALTSYERKGLCP